jgi:hypothetical protein
VIQILEGKFKKKFFAGILVVLVVFGVLGGNLHSEGATKSWNPIANFLGVSQEEMDDRFLETQASDMASYYSNEPEVSISLSAFLLTEASNFLQWTISDKLYNDVFFSPQARMAISVAWKAVRDFVNMFYLLILIFLAITTILQINKFSDKKLFLKVLVSAILVNFSMAITVFVIDASNIVMDFFVTAINTTAQGKDIGAFFLKYSGYTGVFAQQPAFVLEKVGINIVEFIVQIIMAVMLMYTGIALLIRLIAYWVLIVLSPLAFFSLAIPGSNSFQEWKDKLLNYSFFGPMMLLFIWIAIVLMSGLNASKDLVQGVAQATNGHFVLFLTSYITVLYLLYYGHDKSKEYASKAGTTVTNILTKGGAAAVKAGKGAALATGVGAVGYTGYTIGKRKVKAQYTGAKALMHKMGIGEQAEKERQERDEAIAKTRWTGGDVQATKERHEMATIAKKEKEMKEGGFDMDNKDALVDLTKNGSKLEKKVAANKLAELNALGGSKLESAMGAAGGNKVLEDKILRKAKSKNRANHIKWAADHYDEDERATKIIKDNIKSLDARVIKGLNKQDRYKRALEEGLLSGLSPEEHVKIINEEVGNSAIEIAREVVKYHNKKVPSERLSSGQLEKMTMQTMNEDAQVMLRGIKTRSENNQQTTNSNPNIEVVSGGPGGDNSRERVVFGPDGKPIR